MNHNQFSRRPTQFIWNGMVEEMSNCIKKSQAPIKSWSIISKRMLKKQVSERFSILGLFARSEVSYFEADLVVQSPKTLQFYLTGRPSSFWTWLFGSSEIRDSFLKSIASIISDEESGEEKQMKMTKPEAFKWFETKTEFILAELQTAGYRIEPQPLPSLAPLFKKFRDEL